MGPSGIEIAEAWELSAEADGADRGGNPVAPNSVDSEVIGSRGTANVYRSWSRAARTRLHRTLHSECLETCSAGVEGMSRKPVVQVQKSHSIWQPTTRTGSVAKSMQHAASRVGPDPMPGFSTYRLPKSMEVPQKAP